MRRVLILDDEAGVLNALQRSLRHCFPKGAIHLETFTDPETALLRCADSPFDVVVADYRMPGMNGAEFLRVVMAVQPTAVRMILSGSTDFEEVTNAVNRAEVFRYLSKPWRADELRDAMLQACARHDALMVERRLADETRARLGELTPQQVEAQRLEAAEPGITWVNWAPDGSVLLDY